MHLSRCFGCSLKVLRSIVKYFVWDHLNLWKPPNPKENKCQLLRHLEMKTFSTKMPVRASLCGAEEEKDNFVMGMPSD